MNQELKGLRKLPDNAKVGIGSRTTFLFTFLAGNLTPLHCFTRACLFKVFLLTPYDPLQKNNIMDTAQNTINPSDYLGLKTELQNIAGIIEQYPDHLKQRAFELLITSYMGSNHAKDSAPPQAQEAQAVVESAPTETVASEVSEKTETEEFFPSMDQADGESAGSELDTVINTNLENSTNMLRRRIRLRTMSPMRWRAPV